MTNATNRAGTLRPFIGGIRAPSAIVRCKPPRPFPRQQTHGAFGLAVSTWNYRMHGGAPTPRRRSL